MSDTLIPTMADIQAEMGSPKAAVLNKEFKISENALYDYYSTNSGMLPKNQSIAGASDGGGDSGGDSGGDESEEITGIKNRMNSAASQASTVSENFNDYNNADDILSSVVKLKKSVQNLNN